MKIRPYFQWNTYKQLEEKLNSHEPDPNIGQEHLKNLDFTIFDLETTGFLPEIGHEVISIGAVRLEGQDACHRKTFHQIVRPVRRVNNHTLKLTGLTRDQLNNASPFIEAFSNFMEFSEGSVLVAHPAKFDMRFLQTMLKRWKLPDYNPPVIDSQKMAQWLLPNVRHQLDPLLRHLGIEKRDRHHALNDAIMTAELYRFLLSKSLEEEVQTLEELQYKLNQQKK
ncbi:3'-5' exonuclease [Halobacillus yeomjeoni]|nr:3'-5' exonuclease [Halobacillus yeomjeoni]MCA0982809.1 3'-5' exonuclease [Halobacillus yeomjeoni]